MEKKMTLTQENLIELYNALVKPFGHPDPMGYMTRAIIKSGADPDFASVDGEIGFMPVNPKRAKEMVGAEQVADLESNIVATLAMDRMLYEEYGGDLSKMVVAFHWEFAGENFTTEQKAFLAEIEDERKDMPELLSPRLATVADVIAMLDENSVNDKLNTKEMKFIKKLLEA